MMFSQRSSSPRSVPHRFACLCLVLAFTPAIFAARADRCFLQELTLGNTYPPGDIELYIGKPLELFCTIDLEKAKEKNYSIDDLTFFKEGQPIDPRYMRRVNETTIRLYMENQTESEYMYYCYLRRNQRSANISGLLSLEVTTGMATLPNKLLEYELVCMNWVAVGAEPGEVENYTCISLNWQMLKCSWDVPKNKAKTKYTINYSPKHRYMDRKYCPTDDDVLHNFCTWTMHSTPLYLKNIKVLRINITGSNKFKSNEQVFFFNHFAHVLMDPPEELKLLTKNTTSVKLQWDIGDLQFFPKPIQYKVQYMHSYNSTNWDTTTCDSKNSAQEGAKVRCIISGLMCYTFYNVRVFMKSSLASDKYWSNYSSMSFRTSACLPADTPVTDNGSS